MRQYLVQFTLLGEKGNLTLIHAIDETSLKEDLGNTVAILRENVTDGISYNYVDVTDEDIVIRNCKERKIN